MIKKFFALLSLAVIGYFAFPSTALAAAPGPSLGPSGPVALSPYHKVPYPIIHKPVIIIGPHAPGANQHAIQIKVNNLLPGSDSVLTVSAQLGANSASNPDATSRSHVQVGPDGTFTTHFGLTEPGTYPVSVTGLDLDGNTTVVSIPLVVSADATTAPSSDGVNGRNLAVGAVALVGAGIAAIVLGRRRSTVSV